MHIALVVLMGWVWLGDRMGAGLGGYRNLQAYRS